MRRKGRSQIITIISLIIVFIALVVAYFFDATNKMVTITATITAVVGVFAVYIQIRKSKLIGQSSFTIEISKYFYEHNFSCSYGYVINTASYTSLH